MIIDMDVEQRVITAAEKASTAHQSRGCANTCNYDVQAPYSVLVTTLGETWEVWVFRKTATPYGATPKQVIHIVNYDGEAMVTPHVVGKVDAPIEDIMTALELVSKEGWD